MRSRGERKEEAVKRNRLQWLGSALAVALLVLGTASVVVAQEEEASAEEVTLTGRLSGDEESGYMLIEQESGETIALKGPRELASHVGSTVTVTGKWAEDTQGNRYFAVSKVEKASTSPGS